MASQAPDHSLDSQSKAAEIVSILSVCCVVTTTLVTLRIITRAWLIPAFGPDDWVLVVAQILAIGAALAIGLEQYYGLGRHIWTVADMVPYLKAFYSSILVYNASLVLVKISIVLMYRRIFVSKGMQNATLVALVVLTAWGIALVTSLAMICLPIDALWDPNVQGHCMPFVPAFFAPAVINMVTDFSIFLLPLPAMRKLQLPMKQKIILSFILCLGLFTCIISIVRLSTLEAAATSSDSTWDNTEAALWSYLELTIAIMAACLPTLRPIMARFFPRFIGSSALNDKNVGSEGRQPTWASSGKDRVRKYGRVNESTDALYSDPEIGLQPLPAVTGEEDIDGYRATEARREQSETTIDSRSRRRSLSRSSSPSGLHVEKHPGIRATTVIRQEYQTR